MGTSPEVAEAMPLKESPEKMALEKNDEDDTDNDKGGLISESFLLWLKSPKIGAKSLSWAVSTKEKMLRRVIWQLFGEILAKVKKFLRLSHL